MRKFAIRLKLFSVCLVLAVCSTSAVANRGSAPKILSVKLMNPTLSAGDTLDLRYVVEESHPIDTNSGLSIWLGFIVQNVFQDSDALNRSSRLIGQTGGNGIYQVTDLRVSPWVVPRQDEYTLEQIVLHDRQANQAVLWAGGDGFYRSQDGTQTEIPVVKFHVNPNPGGDIVPPQIHAARLQKTSYRVGESLAFEVTATDAVSGIREGCCVGSAGSVYGTYSPVNGRLKRVGPEQYIASGFLVAAVPTGGQRVVVLSLGFADRAGHYGQLSLRDPGDPYYWQGGKETRIEAMSFVVEPVTSK